MAISNGIPSHDTFGRLLGLILYVAFREDDQQVRSNNSPENFAVLRHIALKPLKGETSSKISIKAKLKKAGWSEAYLLKVLSIYMQLP